MASKVPFVNQIAWVALIPQILFLGLLMFIYYLLNVGDFVLLGAITYLVLSYVVRKLMLKSFYRGIKLLKKLEVEAAIPYFETCVGFFSRNSWLDKYRYLMLLSSSKMTFREMSLCNIAFCYGQINEGQKSKKLYEQILKEYPDNVIALTALKMIQSFSGGSSLG